MKEYCKENPDYFKLSLLQAAESQGFSQFLDSI